MRHGFLLIAKPSGPTSHDVVATVRRVLPEKSIGHLGTLDPLATGLLVLAVGKKALKVVELFNELPKEYIADVRLGAVSTTYDAEGVIEERKPPMGWEIPEQAIIQRLIADRFLGKIQQVPPGYSAIKVSGERAYRKMQQGRPVNLPPREVEITSCKILSYEYPNLRLKIACGSGTYIRSLAHDLGELLHCGGYLTGLQRTRVGEWSVENAVDPDKANWTDVLPLKDVLKDLPGKELTESDFEEIKNGRNIEAEVVKNTIGWFEGLPVAILVPGQDGTGHARKVF